MAAPNTRTSGTAAILWWSWTRSPSGRLHLHRWYADKALTEPIDDIRMTSNKTVYAGWERTGVPDWLNGDDHFAYIIGRDDGLVHPEAPITRAEVATIFFRLLTDEARDEYLTETSPFADVASDAWYATAVATMQAMGIVEAAALRL